MEKKFNINIFILSISIFLGLFSVGSFLGKSIVETKKMDRVVSVKGLSEKEVMATLAIWPIKYLVVSDSLQDIYNQIENNNNKIIEFLEKNGIEKDEISISAPSISDKANYNYDKSIPRFSATQTITVRTKKVSEISKLNSKTLELVKNNISIVTDSYSPNDKIQFFYTDLAVLKPKMIEEATHNARMVALKFAKDSESSLGKIKSASQGYFTIESNDANNPQLKKIRVVTNIQYYLVD